MPPKKRAESQDKLTKQGKQFAEEIWKTYQSDFLLADDRFPVETDKLIATLYGREAPFDPENFSVPGVDSPSKKLQMFVDKERPFTGTFQCIDPDTGYAKKSKLGVNSRQCLSEWLTVAFAQFNSMAKKAKDLQTGTNGAEEATKYVRDNIPNLAKIYRMLWFLKGNKSLSPAESKKVNATMKRIETWLTFESNLQLAKKIQAEQADAFNGAVDLLKKGNLSAREQSTLASTLMKIAGDNPNYAAQKIEVANIQAGITTNENAKVDAAVTEFADYIDFYKGRSYEKQTLVRNYILKELKSPKKTLSLDLPSNKFNTEEDKTGINSLIADLARYKRDNTTGELNQIAKKLEERYADVKPVSLSTQASRFSSPEDRTILSKYTDYSQANSKFDSLSGKTIEPVCETIDEKTVQEFLANYVNYHELMSLYMIFYYTGCSPYYDNAKSIKAMANDWLRWLQGNPFHVRFGFGRVDSVDDLRIDEFNKIAPQNFFPLLSEGWLESDGKFKKNAYGFTASNSTDTFSSYTSGYQKMVATADSIVKACGSKTNITEYSKGIKFLATFVQNFNAIYDAVNKEGAIRWVKRENGEIVREQSSNAIAKCEGALNMGTLAASLKGTAGVSQPSQPSSAKKTEPVVVPSKLLTGPVSIRFHPLRERDVQVLLARQANQTPFDDIQGAKNWRDSVNYSPQNLDPDITQPNNTFVTVSNLDSESDTLYNALVRIGYMIENNPLFAFTDGGADVDPTLPKNFVKDADTSAWFAAEGLDGSKYNIPLNQVFNKDNLTTDASGQTYLDLKVSAWKNDADVPAWDVLSAVP